MTTLSLLLSTTTDIAKSLETSLSGEGSSFIQLIFVFGLGFLSSLTPCVYPLIPITLSIFGAKQDTPRKEAFLLSLSYVMGIAVTYTALGLISAKTGAVFGSFLGNRYVLLFIVAVLVILALFSLDAIKLNFTYLIQNKASRVGSQGKFGAFLMGLVSGLVAAPCVGPILVVLLGFVASSGDSIWGGLLLFSYSLGLGLIFLVLGTYSNLINKLPKSGNWLLYVKFIISSGLFLVAIFLLSQVFEIKISKLVSILTGLLALALAIFANRNNKTALKCFAALLLAFAFSPLLLGFKTLENKLVWLNSLEAAKNIAVKENKPIMIDFYADWCLACKEFEHKTFPDPTVKALMLKFLTVQYDFTEMSEEDSLLSEEYQISGLPMIIFLDSSGKEIPDTRISGFLEPEEFGGHLEKVLGFNVD